MTEKVTLDYIKMKGLIEFNLLYHNVRSAISYQLSAISYQLSAISYQLSAISYQLSAISYQLSAISYQLSAISYQLSARKFARFNFHVKTNLS
ncbi:hypothetical protein [Pseudoalteromonas sp. KAN5]|uniref:hypothetical protein n=1 Tax=Pseudoalteromonas sp. KAN5 TaxID=2916633 RepID=UPI001FCA63EB|nr:hypothetical protein [Pseudoalteromonas sp. KAN5]BDF96315.1 hypothetical protein KAN5_31530 [Pseudoalteromonas sp. KAN5]